MTHTLRRAWFQIHLSTAVGLISGLQPASSLLLATTFRWWLDEAKYFNQPASSRLTLIAGGFSPFFSLQGSCLKAASSNIQKVRLKPADEL